MSANDARAADFLPLLSRGKHRSPRRGACLMEYASYLANEKWSDHPSCTHPLLAELARQVNDFSSDGARQRLLEAVPDLIGATGDDLLLDVRIALRAAQAALPVVAEERQRMMAVAVLSCERLAADLQGRPASVLSAESRHAMALAPGAARWAQDVTRNRCVSRRTFRRRMAPAIVRYAVQGIAHACVADRDALLHRLLIRAIQDCRPTAAVNGQTRRAPLSL